MTYISGETKIALVVSTGNDIYWVHNAHDSFMFSALRSIQNYCCYIPFYLCDFVCRLYHQSFLLYVLEFIDLLINEN